MTNAKKKVFVKILSWATVFLILFFLFKSLIANWHRIKEYQFEINPYYLILSVLLFFAGAVIASEVWRFVLFKSGLESSRWKTFKIHFLSRFGVYVPGKIWFLLIRSRLSQKDSFSQKTIITTSILEAGISMIAPSILSLIFMGSYFLDRAYFLITTAIVILGSIILLRPKIFYFLLNFGLKKIKKEPIPENYQLKSANLLVALILTFAYWIIWGVSFYFFVRSIVIVPLDKIFDLTGIYIVSSTVGALAIFVPYGLGIRESLQSYLLTRFFPWEIAVLVSFLTRIWIIANDLVLGLILQVMTFSSSMLSKKKIKDRGL